MAGNLKYLGLSLLLGVLLAACAGTPVQTRHLRFEVAPTLNMNTPLALDVVVVYDAQVLAALQKLSAKQWMAQKQQFKRDYPLLLRLWEWELVPGEALPEFEVPALGRAAGILLFADYATPGLHRARLDPFQEVLVSLGEKDMQLYAN